MKSDCGGDSAALCTVPHGLTALHVNPHDAAVQRRQCKLAYTALTAALTALSLKTQLYSRSNSKRKTKQKTFSSGKQMNHSCARDKNKTKQKQKTNHETEKVFI